MLVTGSDGRIRQVNWQAEHLFGYHRNELLGQTVEFLMPPRFRGIHRKHRAAYFAQPRLRPMGQGLDLMARRKDGTDFPVDISLSPIRGEKGTLAILAIRDITEQRRMEAALRQSEEHFRIALMQLPVVVFNQDRHLRYTWIHSSLPAWIGQEYIGHHDTEIFDRKEAARISAFKRGVLRSGAGARDETKVIILGREHYFDIIAEPLRGRRQFIIGITGAYFDVSHLKCYALERERLIGELKSALEQVKLLSGLISICASCKRIFNEQGAWQQMESYIQAHSDVKFSHGLCPECIQKLYPDYCER